jgi:hypothetical protein
LPVTARLGWSREQWLLSLKIPSQSCLFESIYSSPHRSHVLSPAHIPHCSPFASNRHFSHFHSSHFPSNPPQSP